jgi:hypothetical protein
MLAVMFSSFLLVSRQSRCAALVHQSWLSAGSHDPVSPGVLTVSQFVIKTNELLDILRLFCDKAQVSRRCTMKTASTNVDYRLLGLMSDLVICSCCLRQGKITPVPQIVSHRHTPRSRCASCTKPRHRNLRRILAKLERS